ncbi:unnamed protein product [Lampetra fluviatilis]
MTLNLLSSCRSFTPNEERGGDVGTRSDMATHCLLIGEHAAVATDVVLVPGPQVPAAARQKVPFGCLRETRGASSAQVSGGRSDAGGWAGAQVSLALLIIIITCRATPLGSPHRRAMSAVNGGPVSLSCRPDDRRTWSSRRLEWRRFVCLG